MKNRKLLVLTAFAALTLAGCGNVANNPAALPDGGKDVDVKEEAGKAEMKARLEGAASAYQGYELKALGLNINSKDINFNANGKLESGFGNFDGKLGLENLGSNLELAVGEVPGDLYSTLGARATLGDSKGKFLIDGDFQQAGAEDKNKVKQSIDLSGILLNAYLVEDKVYLDGSNSGLLEIVDRASGFANGIVNDLDFNLAEIVSLTKMLGYDLSAFFSKDEKSFDFRNAFETYTDEGKAYIKVLPFIVPWSLVPTVVSSLAETLKTADPETSKSQIDTFVENYVDLTANISGLKFKTYGEKGFGLQADVTKDSLKAIVTKYADKVEVEEGQEKPSAEEINKQIDKYFNKIDLSASIYFNDKGLLESVSTYINVEANIKMGEEELAETPLTSVDFVLSASETTKLTVSYDDAVELKIPSAEELATYKEIVIPSGEEGETQE